MKNKCFSCKFRADPEIGGCSHSPDRENPIRGNATDDCPFLKLEGRSRWQQKVNVYGKIISPMQQPNPAPMNPEIRSETPEPTGFSLASWASPDGLGSISFLTKDGEVFHPETGEFMGLLEDFRPKEPTEQELQESVRWLKQKFQIK